MSGAEALVPILQFVCVQNVQLTLNGLPGVSDLAFARTASYVALLSRVSHLTSTTRIGGHSLCRDGSQLDMRPLLE